MKYIASCSFGKDSLAMILVILEHGLPLDEAVYCRVMFNDTISAEFPEHEEWIHSTAIPRLESLGVPVKIVQQQYSYCDRFYRVRSEKAKFAGELFGFPFRNGPWCNSDLKIAPIKKYQRTLGDFTSYVGIAADEVKRVERAREKGQIAPLADYGITEAEAREIARKGGLLSPYYDNHNRNGCWFCHNQRIAEFRALRKDHPELWAEMLKLQEATTRKFTQRASMFDFDARFAGEEEAEARWKAEQITLFDTEEDKHEE